MNEVEKCPKCGGELEEGLLRAPRGVCGETEEYEWHIYSSDALVSMRSWTIAGSWRFETQEMQTGLVQLLREE